MGIGEILAEARHRAGLSVGQVSERTRIRPLIIRRIEAGDYSVCSSGSCARKDIHRIAEAVGTDPGPLLAQCARICEPGGPVPTASPDEPAARLGPAWHGQPAFMLSFAVAAILIVTSSVGYRLMQGPGPAGATVAAGSHAGLLHLADRTGSRPDAAQAASGLASSAPVLPAALGRAHTMEPASVAAFGPDGRSQGDDPQGAWRAIDGHRPTAWHTGRYPAACFRAPYPGTGLLLDMGHPVTITAVRVTIGAAAGATFQIRIGDRPTLAGLQAVTSSAGPGGIVRPPQAHPVAGRYVLVWFTRLPPGPDGTYQAAVHGIGVHARS